MTKPFETIVLFPYPDEIQDFGYMKFTGNDPENPLLRNTVTCALQYREGSLDLHPAIRWVYRARGQDEGNLILMPHLAGQMRGWLPTLTPESPILRALRNDCRRWLMRAGILEKERVSE